MSSEDFWKVLYVVVLVAFVLALVSNFMLRSKLNEERQTTGKLLEMNKKMGYATDNILALCKDPVYLRVAQDMHVDLYQEVDWESLRINHCRRGNTWSCTNGMQMQ